MKPKCTKSELQRQLQVALILLCVLGALLACTVDKRFNAQSKCAELYDLDTSEYADCVEIVVSRLCQASSKSLPTSKCMAGR